MPFKFLTLYKAKAHRAVPGPSSPSSDLKRTHCPGSWVDSITALYDPATHPPKDPTAATSPRSASSVRLTSTPLADLDDSSETDAETERVVDEVRRELAQDEFVGTIDAVAPAAFAACENALLETMVHHRHKRERDLLEFYGADEDAVELTGELDIDEGADAVVETLFDCELDAGSGRAETESEGGSDDSWRTTDDIAAWPTGETVPGSILSGKDGFVSRWLGFGIMAQAGQTAVLEAEVPGPEPMDLVEQGAAEWAGADAGADNENASGSSGSDSLRRLQRELDSVLAHMETAEEGRATEMGPVREMRHYGDMSGHEVEYVVVDRPSLDFLDRLEALEGANLRRVRE